MNYGLSNQNKNRQINYLDNEKVFRNILVFNF